MDYFAVNANVPYRADTAPQGQQRRDGQVLRAEFLVHTSAAMVTGDRIRFPLKLKKGSKVLTQQSYVRTLVNAASALTVHIGDDDGEGDPDRYATALDVADAGAADAFDEHPEHRLTEDAEIFATITGTLTSPLDAGRILFVIFYSPS